MQVAVDLFLDGFLLIDTMLADCRMLLLSRDKLKTQLHNLVSNKAAPVAQVAVAE